MKYNLNLDSCLDWDDSEERSIYVGEFDDTDIDGLRQLIATCWDYDGEDILNDKIIEEILKITSMNNLDPTDNSFTILEDDSTVQWESCRRRYTFTVLPVLKELSESFYDRGFGCNIASSLFGTDEAIEAANKVLVNELKTIIEQLAYIKNVNYIELIDNKLTITAEIDVE